MYKRKILEGIKRNQKEALELYLDVHQDKYFLAECLREAAYHNKIQIAKLLLRKNADVNLVDDNIGNTACFRAALGGNVKMLQLLIKHGANTKKTNQWNQTPLWAAVANGHLKVVKFLLRHDQKFYRQYKTEYIFRKEINRCSSAIYKLFCRLSLPFLFRDFETFPHLKKIEKRALQKKKMAVLTWCLSHRAKSKRIFQF